MNGHDRVPLASTARKVVHDVGSLASAQASSVAVSAHHQQKEGRSCMNNNELTRADARKLVDAVFASVAEAASNGDEVALSGFGKFKVKDTPAREGRNPATGEKIEIAASKKLSFTPAKAIKDRLNG
jgi:DNA-binding protein HU-beta